MTGAGTGNVAELLEESQFDVKLKGVATGMEYKVNKFSFGKHYSGEGIEEIAKQEEKEEKVNE